MPSSVASAEWKGGLKGGQGRFEAGSGAFSGAYSFPTRFEGAAGTNPEELIAAAHAACLSMALSAGLEKEGKVATSIRTTATCTLEMVGGAPKVSSMRLEVVGRVPGLDRDAFAKAAQAAKANCPISGALKGNVAIELTAALES